MDTNTSFWNNKPTSKVTEVYPGHEGELQLRRLWKTGINKLIKDIKDVKRLESNRDTTPLPFDYTHSVRRTYLKYFGVRKCCVGCRYYLFETLCLYFDILPTNLADFDREFLYVPFQIAYAF